MLITTGGYAKTEKDAIWSAVRMFDLIMEQGSFSESDVSVTMRQMLRAVATV